MASSTGKPDTKCPENPTQASANSASDAPVKSKAELRAERRAKQEAQRAAKAARKTEGGSNPQQGGEDGKAAGGTPNQKGKGGAADKKAKPAQGQATKERNGSQKGKDGGAAPTPAGKGSGATGQAGKGGEGQKSKGGGGDAQLSKGNTDVQQNADSTPSETPGLVDAQIRVPTDIRLDDPSQQRKLAKTLVRRNLPCRPTEKRRVPHFCHLPQYDRRERLFKGLGLSHRSKVHPAFLELGQLMDEGRIIGSHTRTLCFMDAVRRLVEDYVCPPDVDWSRDLLKVLLRQIAFLDQCRPLAVTMRTLIADLKTNLTAMDRGLTHEESTKVVFDYIEKFLETRINLARESITKHLREDILKKGDVILVYGYCSLVNQALRTAWENGVHFSVIVADTRPDLDGRRMARSLTKYGIPCRYILLTAVPTIMSVVSRVIVGCYALLGNGHIIAQIGTGHIHNLAAAFNLPMLVLCETSKLWDRAQTDAFECNEILDPDLVGLNSDWHRPDTPLPLCLRHDVVEPTGMTVMVLTEVGLIMPARVPIWMRVKKIGDV